MPAGGGYIPNYARIKLQEKDCWLREADKWDSVTMALYSHLVPGLAVGKDDVLMEEYFPGRRDYLVEQLNPSGSSEPCMILHYDDGGLEMLFREAQFAAVLTRESYTNGGFTYPNVMIIFREIDLEPRAYFTTGNNRVALPIESENLKKLGFAADKGKLAIRGKCSGIKIFLGDQFTVKGAEAIRNKEVFRKSDSPPPLEVSAWFH